MFIVSNISISYAETFEQLYEKGKINYNSQNYDDALVSFDTILKQDENNRNALYYKGLILIQNNDLILAMKQFETILNQNPQDIKALENKGQILLEWKRYDQAITTYEKILEFDPGNTTANAKLWTAQGIKEQLNDPNPNDTEFVDFIPIIIFVLIAVMFRPVWYLVRNKKRR